GTITSQHAPQGLVMRSVGIGEGQEAPVRDVQPAEVSIFNAIANRHLPSPEDGRQQSPLPPISMITGGDHTCEIQRSQPILDQMDSALSDPVQTRSQSDIVRDLPALEHIVANEGNVHTWGLTGLNDQVPGADAACISIVANRQTP